MTTIVSLLTPEEVRELDLEQEEQLCTAAGVSFTTLPIPDRGLPPSRPAVDQLVVRLLGELRAGKSVAVHCRQGIGRSTLLAASVLVRAGEDPDRALSAVQAARGRPVPDTPEQETWVRSWAPA